MDPERKEGGRIGRGARRGAVVLLALVAVGLWLDHRWSIALIAEEDAVPVAGVALTNLEGSPVGLEDYRGRVVLLNLWASWCGPCRDEIPGLSMLSNRLGERGLVVLGVNVDDLPPEQVAQAGARLGIEYPILLPAQRGRLGSLGFVEVLPYSWLIDRQGRLRAMHAGWAPARSFRRACTRLLDES